MGREWERVEEGEVSLRVTGDQGGRILSQQGGFQVSKGDKGESARGVKSKGTAPYIYCILYMCI